MKPYSVVWKGPVHKASGLGRASRAYVRSLRRQGVAVRVGNLSQSITPARRKRALIYHHIPSRIQWKKERSSFDPIILNTVWETTMTPKGWLPEMNKFDAICVPSQHNKRALENSGVKVPIFIVPHGVNTKEFHPNNKKLDVPSAAGKFTFVSVFGFQHRKNPEGLLRAYWEEFSSADNVILVIKTNGYAAYENEKWIQQKIWQYKKRLGIRKDTAPVVIIGRRLSESQLKGLYTLGDAFVLPTRGEGVGLPFLEALASGVPVIATGWGGQMDFLTPNNSFLIPYQLRNPSVSMNNPHAISRKFSNLFAQKGQKWAEPDLHSLKRIMRNAYENPALCKAKGRKGRVDMFHQSWDRAGMLMKHAIEKVIRSKN
ncbi:glycosyltransferase family 4 protein [Paenibacillus aceris]|uniref:Glycosyltransferase involved in cell wall biosynthesis n=1 Tax=Paenibacillus aceris TaxID=869555 RepID=A0ABS4I0C9_9BACL|nr:glycosyltransferase family 4 protein [Paenibacillus aceris]MBP1964275.1 glycosyltransferase involved in cell wall biosynthesis [Paenibacillus aceris]NHW36596.1 glycosyltransferase family 4 protein [Paenibacillus aceris]